MSSQNPREFWRKDDERESKISLAVLAYAAGDAFGVQFEFAPKVTGDISHKLLEIPGWPRGGVSDDTLLSVLTIQALRSPTPESGQMKFLELLRKEVPRLRGLGPTTRAALDLPIKEPELSQVGYSNGGMMRTALAGLAFQSTQPSARRTWIAALASATHKTARALDCAQLLAAGFSAALEMTDSELVLLAIEREAKDNPEISHETKTAILSWRSWSPPEIGVSNDSLQSLLATMFVASKARSTKDAYSIACSLGGDTDTVAALSGSLYAATFCDADAFFEIEWINEVDWHGIVNLPETIEILVERNSEHEF